MEKNLKYVPFVAFVVSLTQLIVHPQYSNAVAVLLSGLFYIYLDSRVKDSEIKNLKAEAMAFQKALQEDNDKTLISISRRLDDIEKRTDETRVYVTSQALGKQMSSQNVKIQR